MHIKPSYQVNPRYTDGSPAQVTEKEAVNRALYEKAAYELALRGDAGDAARLRAEALGQEGIVEELTPTAGGFDVVDMISGRITRR